MAPSKYPMLDDAAMRVLGDFTPLVNGSPLIEAFADVERLFGPPVEIASWLDD
jgi:DNA polymerase IV